MSNATFRTLGKNEVIQVGDQYFTNGRWAYTGDAGKQANANPTLVYRRVVDIGEGYVKVDPSTEEILPSDEVLQEGLDTQYWKKVDKGTKNWAMKNSLIRRKKTEETVEEEEEEVEVIEVQMSEFCKIFVENKRELDEGIQRLQELADAQEEFRQAIVNLMEVYKKHGLDTKLEFEFSDEE